MAPACFVFKNLSSTCSFTLLPRESAYSLFASLTPEGLEPCAFLIKTMLHSHRISVTNICKEPLGKTHT